MGCCASYPVGKEGEKKEKLQLKKTKQKVEEEFLSAQAKNDAILGSVRGRLITNGAGNAVVVHSQQGAKGINQDAVVVWEGFTAAAGAKDDDDDDDDDTVFCGVFDGHGPFGHLAAQRVRDSLPSKLIHYWQQQELAAIKSTKEAATTGAQEKIPPAAKKTMQIGNDDDNEDADDDAAAGDDDVDDKRTTTTTATTNGNVHEAATAAATTNGNVHEAAAAAAATTNGNVHEAAAARSTNGGVHEAEADCNGGFRAESVKKNKKNKNVNSQNGAVQEDFGMAMFEAWKKSHLAAYKIMDKELQWHPEIDCFCSGTTSVTLLKQAEHLVIGNLGDSRAVMGTKDENGKLVPVQLTTDLKPTVPQEADRIRQCKGRVYALKNEPHLQRVWLPHEEAPGLAMSRTFGDFCLKDYGIIAVPELSYRRLTDQDQFVVLATDGIWDVLSNEEVMELIASAPTRATAACTLVEGAIRVWQLKFPSAKIDDCAVVCIYLDDDAAAPIDSQTSKSKEEEKAADTKETSSSQAGSNATQMTLNEEGRQTPSQSKLVDLSISANDEEWTALEGITRANSLVNLPSLLLQTNNTTS